jgi:hypothetical protein
LAEILRQRGNSVVTNNLDTGGSCLLRAMAGRDIQAERDIQEVGRKQPMPYPRL